jgi:hypothetical protein
METSTIEIRLRRAEDIRAWWLDGFADGGVFVPGLFALSAGTPVLVRLLTELPVVGSTVLSGMVIWRRLPTRNETAATLRPGIGIAFEPSMRSRVIFLDRLGRGAASDSRGGVRYPTLIASEIAVRESERAQPAEVLDVGPRGARILMPRTSFVEAGSAVRVWIAPAQSGESSFAPLSGRVAWLDRSKAETFGVRLDLANKDDRLHWAKVVTRAREAIERDSHRVDRLVG